MNWSLSTVIFGERILTPAMLEKLARAGCLMLDFCAGKYAHPAVAAPYNFCGDEWRAWVQQLRDSADRLGIRFNQSHNATCNFFDDRIPECERFAAPRNIVEATAMLGGKYTVVHPVIPPGDEYNWPRILTKNRDYFRRLGDYAARYGITLCIENMLSNRYFDGSVCKRCCTDMDELLELVESVAYDNVKICIDVGHAHYMGLSAGEAIRRSGALLKSLHLHDNDSFSDQHLPPYCGTMDWTDIFCALHAVDYAGELTLEIQNPFFHIPDELLRDSLKYIECIGKYFAELYETG